MRLRNGNTLSYEATPGAGASNLLTPADQIFHNLDYNGGPVMPANTNYAFYWDPPGAPAYPSDYQPGIDRYFEDLAAESGGLEQHRLGVRSVQRRGRGIRQL